MADADPRRTHSLGEIAGGLAGDVQDLIRGELALARAEIDRKMHSLILALVAVIGGGLIAFAGLVVLLEGGAAVLAFWLPAWASLLVVGVVIVAVGGIVARVALSRLTLREATPERTIKNVERDVHVVKAHAS